MRGLATLLVTITIAATAYSGTGPRKMIGMKRATAIASARVRGVVKSKELEKEHGRWIYSFDIGGGRSGVTEVHVDALTGRVLSIEHEGARREADEERNEKKRH